MKDHRYPGNLAITLFLVLGWFSLYGQEEREEEITPESVEELQQAIQEVLEETKTPAVGIALVDSAGPVWVGSLGYANTEDSIPAGENTMYRIGSTSKMFVALAILKLQEEGKVSLKDKVRDLAPDVEFTNPWADEAPILVEHLLEHTTGWDDIHMTEYAHNEPDPVTLKEGLDYHPHSRTSRWMPGSRMSYCNSGPPVAAYIVEQITGKTFEDYAREVFFDPMGMETMTYFETEDYKDLRATLYLRGVAQPYWHIIMRPSGAINASPDDMARMLSFFIHRGMVDSVQVISDASLRRMERVETTSGAQSGLEYGYGLHNYSTPYEGFVYRTHNGGVNGGLTDFSYLPAHQLGYAVMINSGNGKALGDIVKLIRKYQTRNLASEAVSLSSEVSGDDLSGFYAPINPRNQTFYFLERLTSFFKLTAAGDTAYVAPWMGGEPGKYIPVGNGKFAAPKTGKIAMTQASDPLNGEVLHRGSQVLQKISPFMVFLQIGIIAFWVMLMIASLLLGLYWMAMYFRKNLKGKAHLEVRVWPILSTLAFLLTIVFFLIGASAPFERLGSPTPASVAIMLGTIAYALVVIWSLWVVIRHRNAGVNKWVYYFASALTAFHLVVVFYFLWYGVIGIRMWA